MKTWLAEMALEIYQVQSNVEEIKREGTNPSLLASGSK
jgi:hypothetical protein